MPRRILSVDALYFWLCYEVGICVSVVARVLKTMELSSVNNGEGRQANIKRKSG